MALLYKVEYPEKQPADDKGHRSAAEGKYISLFIVLIPVAEVVHERYHYEHSIPQDRIGERPQQKRLQAECFFVGFFHYLYRSEIIILIKIPHGQRGRIRS